MHSRTVVVCALLLAVCMSTRSLGSVQAGIFSSGTQLVIKAKPSANLTGNASGGIITITWAAADNVTLGAITSTVGSWLLDVAGTTGGTAYQVIAFTSPPVTAITWTAGTEYELFRVAVNQTGSGVGSFTLMQSGLVAGANWYFEVNGSINQTNSADPYYQPTIENVPLPITLSSFTLRNAPQKDGIDLAWTTISEINNYGFYIQRRPAGESVFADIPESFIPGHGTTLEPQQYSFTDRSVTAGTWYYRLRQVDLDGAEHYSDELQSEMLTSVVELAPKEFTLLQNYPNPFNPSTEIKFSVEATDHATLQVFNMLGQNVATLFDGPAEAGRYYSVRFEGTTLSSGVYLYLLQSGKKSDLRKLVLLK